MQATLTSKGQITIPRAVRESLKLRTGDRLDFTIGADGSVRIVPLNRSVVELKGMLPRPRKALSLAAMDQAIVRGASRR